jgi:hypothetical protein
MAEEEQDPERRQRIAALVIAIQRATDEQIIGDVQVALANVIALMCLSREDPEHLFLVTQESLSEVFRAQRQHRREGKAPDGPEGLN